MPRFDDAPVTWIILIAWLGMAGLTGLLSPSSEALLRYGAAMPLLVPDEPWRLLAYSFLHHGFLHLAMNAIGFAWIAPSLEQALGGVRFVTLYVVSAVIGGVCGGLGIHPLAELAGGSGAVFGVFGAAIAMLMHLGRSKLEFLHYHGPRSLVTLIAANFAIGLMLPRVSNAAHLGGLIAGFVFVFVFCGRERAAPDRWTHVAKSAWLALGLVAVLYALRPVLAPHWSVRRALDAPTQALRTAHEVRLAREGLSSRLEALQWQAELEYRFGELGVEYARRIFR
jgi:membrane associated rhomboid family serine protease/uncharacterized protein YjeT (DUF2065 family)